MAAYPEVPMPERPRGTTEEQIARLYRDLWQIAETMNNILQMMQREAKRNGDKLA